MIFSSVTEFPALSFTNKYAVILPAIKLETFDWTVQLPPSFISAVVLTSAPPSSINFILTILPASASVVPLIVAIASITFELSIVISVLVSSWFSESLVKEEAVTLECKV